MTRSSEEDQVRQDNLGVMDLLTRLLGLPAHEMFVGGACFTNLSVLDGIGALNRNGGPHPSGWGEACGSGAGSGYPGCYDGGSGTSDTYDDQGYGYGRADGAGYGFDGKGTILRDRDPRQGT